MKNLTMRVLPLSLFALSLFGSAKSQTIGSNAPLEIWSQMWNPANTYYNTAHLNPGYQTDTVSSGSGAAVLWTSRIGTKWHSQVDSILYQPLNGNGKINYTAYVWKGQKVTTTVNPVVTCTLGSTTDPSLPLIPVIGATVFTLTPTSGLKANAKICSWPLQEKQNRYYGITFSAITDTATVIAEYDYNQYSQIER